MKFIKSMAFRRGALLLLLIIPSVWAWWSVSYRLPLLNHTKQRLSMLSELDTNIGIAKKGWTTKKATKVMHDWAEVDAQMIGSYEQLAGWLEDMGEGIARSGYTLNYRMENPIPSHSAINDGLSTIAITLDLRPRGQSSHNYLKTVAFIRALVEQQTGVHLDGLTLKGNGKGLGETTIAITVWVSFVDRTKGERDATHRPLRTKVAG